MNEKISELDPLTTADQADVFAVVDTSEEKTKKITQENLENTIAGSDNFVDHLVENEYFTETLANNSNFITELTESTEFQTQINNFVEAGGASGSAVGGKPKSFSLEGLLGSPITNGYQDIEAYVSVNGTTVYLEVGGEYLQSRVVTTDWADADQINSYVIRGGYIYLLLRDNTAPLYRVYRYDITNFNAAGTLMTIATQAFGTQTGMNMSANGTDFFFNYQGGNSANDYVISKYTLSGTTLTHSSNTSLGATAAVATAFAVFDNGDYYGLDIVNAREFRRYNSSGTLQDTFGNYDTSYVNLLNWAQTLYIIKSSNDDEAYRVALPTDPALGLEFTADAAENMTAGEVVGTSNLVSNSVARDDTTVYNFATGFGFDVDGDDKPFAVVEIGTDKVVALVQDANTGDLYVAAGIVTRTNLAQAIDFGTPVLITNDHGFGTDFFFDIHKLDTDKFAVAYRTDSDPDEIQIVAGTVATSTITLGTPAILTSVASGSIVGLNMAQLGTDKGVCVYENDSGSIIQAIVYTYSGTTATIGAAANVNANLFFQGAIAVGKIATDKFCIAGTEGTGGNIGRGQIGTLSGTTITLGTAFTFGGTVTLNADFRAIIASPADNVMVISYNMNNGGGNVALIAATVSGTTPTFGAEIGSTAGSFRALLPLTATTLYFFADTDLKLLTLSGATITISGLNVTTGFSTTNKSASKFLISPGGYFLALYFGTSNVTYFIEGMSTNQVGILQNSVLRGETARVLYNGIDTKYQALLGSNLTPGNTYEGYRALSTNELLVK